MKLLKKIDKNLERWVMFLLLAGMTLVLGIQIFCRFVLNNSLTWSEELARFMFIWSTFLSIGFCLKEGISLKIDTLISLFPKKVQAVILLLGDVVMTVFFLYLLPSAWEFAYASVENGQTSAACGIPMYFVQGSLMVGFALAAFRAAQGVWSNLRTLLQYVSRGPFCPVFCHPALRPAHLGHHGHQLHPALGRGQHLRGQSGHGPAADDERRQQPDSAGHPHVYAVRHHYGPGWHLQKAL